LRKIILVIPLFAILAGCNPNKNLMPFLGKWIGRFEVSEIEGGGTANDLKREQMKGYVQVYATERTYKMEMEGEQETISISGNWTIKANRITLTPKEIRTRNSFRQPTPAPPTNAPSYCRRLRTRNRSTASKSPSESSSGRTTS